MKITDSKDETRWPPDSNATMRTARDEMISDDGARVTLIHGHEYVLTYFERRIEPHGIVRVITTRNGLEIWAGGERRWVGTGKEPP